MTYIEHFQPSKQSKLEVQQLQLLIGRLERLEIDRRDEPTRFFLFFPLTESIFFIFPCRAIEIQSV